MKRSLLFALLTSALPLTLSACHADMTGQLIPEPPTPTGNAALLKATSCADVQSALLQQRLDELDVQMRASELQALQWVCASGYGYPDAGVVSPVADAGPASPATSATGAATQVSTTNVQVAGVDEPDFVKNDNQYIYQVSNGALHIVAAYPAASMHEVARYPIAGEPRELFVVGDTAIVYAAEGTVNNYANGWSGVNCTYGYSCEPTGDGTSTSIYVLDIHDRTAPVQLRKIDVTSSFISARRIGNAVYTVLSAAPPQQYYPTTPSNIGCDSSQTQIIGAFNTLRTQNIAAIKASFEASGMPSGQDSAAPGDDIFGGCTNVFKSGILDGSTFTSVLSFDMSTTAPATALSVVGRPGFTYASNDALYLAVRHTPAPNTDFASAAAIDPDEVSTVHKFALDANTSSATYVATGVLPGHVINQFSIDEQNGYLRVAGTHGMVADASGNYNNVSSTLAIMAQQGNLMVRIAGIDNIAPDEDIRSVRFDGDRGYVCTFKKTDPLFVFDLQNPNAPRQLGALQVPGFSTYMQMMDANHLLTIGFDADDQGSYALFEGILLQIFDVTDPANPTQLFKEEIGTRGSSSAALTDHLAFNYFATENLLAIPVTICESTPSQYGSYVTPTFNGLRVYKVTATAGFVLQGQIASAESTASSDDNLCADWWSDSTSTVKRSVIMDNDVYAVSQNVLQVDDIATLGRDVAQVSFSSP